MDTQSLEGRLITFTLDGKRVTGTVIKTIDRRHVLARGRSGKVVKVDMLDQYGLVTFEPNPICVTIWRDEFPPLEPGNFSDHRIDDPKPPVAKPNREKPDNQQLELI